MGLPWDFSALVYAGLIVGGLEVAVDDAIRLMITIEFTSCHDMS